MSTARTTAEPGFALRVATALEIDALCAIDDDATLLYQSAGLDLSLPPEHEFCIEERRRWSQCIAAGTVLIAVSASSEPIGFAAVRQLDGQPYLDQLSVRTTRMRLGIGSALLRAIEKRLRDAGERALWLTTYGHLPWNRPFYQRSGFVAVAEADCGPEMLAELVHQRRWLPLPGERVVMRKDIAPDRRGTGR
jgi:GNAT superfamily N-acetyltransferase